MKQHFNRIILYARHFRANPEISESLQRLADFLVQRGVSVFLDIDTATSFHIDLPLLSRDDMGKKGDLIVVVGGDGSLLSAARMAVQVNTPVIGINRGRLGFLTDITPQTIEQSIAAVLEGHYQEEYRFLLQASFSDQRDEPFVGDALNDVVLSGGNVTHLIDFDVYINQRFVSHYRADGLILSTPTGSTAYALSAGGPIMHPKLNAIVLVPMFSHSLSSRPLVVDGDVSISLNISELNDRSLNVSCDGHESRSVQPGQTVTIKKKTRQLCLLHPTEYHYYDTLRIKLGWEAKHQG